MKLFEYMTVKKAYDNFKINYTLKTRVKNKVIMKR